MYVSEVGRRRRGKGGEQPRILPRQERAPVGPGRCWARAQRVHRVRAEVHAEEVAPGEPPGSHGPGRDVAVDASLVRGQPRVGLAIGIADVLLVTVVYVLGRHPGLEEGVVEVGLPIEPALVDELELQVDAIGHTNFAPPLAELATPNNDNPVSS